MSMSGVREQQQHAPYRNVPTLLSKRRLFTTSMYFVMGTIISVGVAESIALNPTMVEILSEYVWKSLLSTIFLIWGTDLLCRAIPYREGFGVKQLTWFLHIIAVGTTLGDVVVLRGPILTQSLLVTTVLFFCVFFLAIVVIPQQQVRNFKVALDIAVLAVMIAFISIYFFNVPPSQTFMGISIFAIVVYGGLIFFGLCMVYDIQNIILMAKITQPDAVEPFDPVNCALDMSWNSYNLLMLVVYAHMIHKINSRG